MSSTLRSVYHRHPLRPSTFRFKFCTTTSANRAASTLTSDADTDATPKAPVSQAPPSAKIEQLAQQAANEAKARPRAGIGPDAPYHINVFAHKQNTHISFTDPGRDVICSYSCGDLGLRHAQRKNFDAAYQLAAFTFRKMAEKSWRIGGKKTTGSLYMLSHADVKRRGIEVVLRGYGVGREAFQKAILGSEGRLVKHLITQVADNTRTKFGGVRSPAVRRL